MKLIDASVGLSLAAASLTFIPAPRAALYAQSGQAVAHGQSAAMDPDHRFLRDLADHSEAMVYLAHSAMQLKHAHMGADAAGATDVAEDARKRDIVAILRSRFKDAAEPVPPPALKAQVDSLMRLDGEAYEAGMKDFMQRHHKSAVDMIDHAKLRRPEVKALAERMRSQYVKEMKANN